MVEAVQDAGLPSAISINDLIFQWGNHFQNNAYPLVTLPIAYKKAHLQGYACCAIQCEYGISCYGLTLTTLSIQSGQGVNKRYFSIGY